MNDAAFPLALQGIRRTFVQGERRLEVLHGVSLELRPGEIVALVGQSGSGKSKIATVRRCGGSSWASSISTITCFRSSRRSRT